MNPLDARRSPDALTATTGAPDRLTDLDGPDGNGDDAWDDAQPSPVDMVVFDIGNVLVHWEPRAALAHALDAEAIEVFLGGGDFDFYAHNLRADGGSPWAQIIGDIEANHPQHAAAARAYVEHFGDAIARPIEGSVQILRELSDAGIPLFAVTNFSAELFGIARDLHGDVLDLFEEIIVSGEEGVVKPDPEIWEILEEVTRHRGGLSDAVFVDDSVANIMSAEEAGLDAVHFTDPETLREDLRLRGLPLRAAGASTTGH